MLEYDLPNGGAERQHWKILSVTNLVDEEIIWEGDSDGTIDNPGTSRVINTGNPSRWYRIGLLNYCNPLMMGFITRWIPTEVIPWAQGFDGGAFQFATAEDGATTSELNLKILYQSSPGVPDILWQNNAVFRQYLRLDLETTSTTITGSIPSVTPPPPPATELEYHYQQPADSV